MGDEPPPRPMANMLNAANESQISVQMTPEDFIYLDRDCTYFKDQIRQIQGLADEISTQDHWGLGEANNDLTSARAMVGRYKVKAKGAPDGNGVFEIMEQHYLIVDDIQNVFRVMRDKMMQADSEWAAAFNSLNESLPDRPPAGPVIDLNAFMSGTT
ncbi:hypothetical protein [Nocardia jinanensis]|uniref:Uncharacterized protein n=1 Tax=Nocardia jinanensis TaxID=382504 RepID=A0A917VWG9_9NOCA|nr:hypothetical protein [Nocardia jinanensis]GGL35309.1 hypothetical protein GCM10011588_57580 [Nocardia jinanensis]